MLFQQRRENAEESYENIVESILSLARVGYHQRLLSAHGKHLGRGLAAISWPGQKLNVTGKRTSTLLA